MAKDDSPKVHKLKASDLVTAGAEIFPPTIRVYDRLPEDHPFYAMVGRVASEWSHVEHSLDLIIWNLLGTSQSEAACVTSQIMGVGPRCKAIINLVRFHGLPPEIEKALRRFMSDSFSAAEWRARWIHDPWYIETGTNNPGQFRAMPYIDPRYGHQDISQDELIETLAHIRELRDRANGLRQEIFDAKSHQKRG